MTIEADLSTDLDLLKSLDASMLNLDQAAARILLALANDAMIAHELVGLLGMKYGNLEAMKLPQALGMAEEVRESWARSGMAPFALQAALMVLASAYLESKKQAEEAGKALMAAQSRHLAEMDRVKADAEMEVRLRVKRVLDDQGYAEKQVELIKRLHYELDGALDYICHLEDQLGVPESESRLLRGFGGKHKAWTEYS